MMIAVMIQNDVEVDDVVVLVEVEWGDVVVDEVAG